MGIFDIAADVIMHCYCIDFNYHDRRNEAPKMARDKLLRFVETYECPVRDTMRSNLNY